MDEYNSVQKLDEIREIVAVIRRNIDHPGNGTYFTLGGYANDSWRLVELVDELDNYLSKGWNFPTQWTSDLETEKDDRRAEVAMEIGHHHRMAALRDGLSGGPFISREARDEVKLPLGVMPGTYFPYGFRKNGK